MFPEAPDPLLTLNKIKKHVIQDNRPADLLYEILSSDNAASNYVGNSMVDYRDTILYLTSPQGRAWIKRWLDDTLNYLQQLAEASK